jgi:hypothetical protein
MAKGLFPRRSRSSDITRKTRVVYVTYPREKKTNSRILNSLDTRSDAVRNFTHRDGGRHKHVTHPLDISSQSSIKPPSLQVLMFSTFFPCNRYHVVPAGSFSLLLSVSHDIAAGSAKAFTEK